MLGWKVLLSVKMEGASAAMLKLDEAGTNCNASRSEPADILDSKSARVSYTYACTYLLVLQLHSCCFPTLRVVNVETHQLMAQ